MSEEKEKQEKQSRCKYCHRFMGKNHDESHCVADGREDEKVKVVSKEDCEQCDRFESRYIEYPLTILDIKNNKIDTKGLGHACGALCEVNPCGKEYEGKSYLEFFLGDLPIAICTSFSRETGVLTNSTMNNPAIFVPELKKNHLRV